MHYLTVVGAQLQTKTEGSITFKHAIVYIHLTDIKECAAANIVTYHIVIEAAAHNLGGHKVSHGPVLSRITEVVMLDIETGDQLEAGVICDHSGAVELVSVNIEVV